MTDIELLRLAKAAKESAYCPYSSVAVGAALLTEDGRVYLGANIENAAYSPSVCAERVAFFKAISEGERKFSKIAIVGGEKNGDTVPLFSPCGVCRQVMNEFCEKDFTIILEDSSAEAVKYNLDSLLPLGFNQNKL